MRTGSLRLKLRWEPVSPTILCDGKESYIHRLKVVHTIDNPSLIQWYRAPSRPRSHMPLSTRPDADDAILAAFDHVAVLDPDSLDGCSPG